MNTLITGGAGFVGSHLAEALVARGHRVTALDNLSTGDAANVISLKTDSRFKLVVGDVTERGTLLPLVEECDVVFHLAAAVGVAEVGREAERRRAPTPNPHKGPTRLSSTRISRPIL